MSNHAILGWWEEVYIEARPAAVSITLGTQPAPVSLTVDTNMAPAAAALTLDGGGHRPHIDYTLSPPAVLGGLDIAAWPGVGYAEIGNFPGVAPALTLSGLAAATITDANMSPAWAGLDIGTQAPIADITYDVPIMVVPGLAIESWPPATITDIGIGFRDYIDEGSETDLRDYPVMVLTAFGNTVAAAVGINPATPGLDLAATPPAIGCNINLTVADTVSAMLIYADYGTAVTTTGVTIAPPSPGSIDMAAPAPSTDITYLLAPSPATMDVGAAAPSVSASVTIAPPAGTITMDSAAAATTTSAVIAPPTAGVDVVAAAPAVACTVNLAPATTGLDLATAAPAAPVDQDITPPTPAVSLGAHAPAAEVPVDVITWIYYTAGNGTLIRAITDTDDVVTINDTNTQITGIAVDAAGALYAAVNSVGTSGGIYRITESSETLLPIPGALGYIVLVTVDAAGTVYASTILNGVFSYDGTSRHSYETAANDIVPLAKAADDRVLGNALIGCSFSTSVFYGWPAPDSIPVELATLDGYRITAIDVRDGRIVAAATELDASKSAVQGWVAEVDIATSIDVVVDHTQVADDQTGFPLYVDLAGMPAQFWEKVRDGGGGIRCYSGDGTELPRDVVACDTTLQTGELHIRTDLSSVEDTVITIMASPLLGDYIPDDPYGSANVWDETYALVYHLGDSDVGDEAVIADATANGYDGTVNGSLISSAAGRLGTGIDLAGGSHVEIDTAAIPAGTAHRTTSAWVNPDVGDGSDIWAMGANDVGQLWEMLRYNDVFALHAYGDGYDTISGAPTLTPGQWHHTVITYDGTDVAVYLDGEHITTVAIPLDTGTDFNNLGGPGYFAEWVGGLDEARLSTVARSPAWIATEYANQSDPDSFYTLTVQPSSPTLTEITDFTEVSTIAVDKFTGAILVSDGAGQLVRIDDTGQTLLTPEAGDIPQAVALGRPLAL